MPSDQILQSWSGMKFHVGPPPALDYLTLPSTQNLHMSFTELGGRFRALPVGRQAGEYSPTSQPGYGREPGKGPKLRLRQAGTLTHC